MENKQMDKRHQRTDDKSNQKTTNGFKKSTKDHKPNAETHGSTAGSDWNSKNQPGSGRYDHDKPGSEPYQGQSSEKGASDTRSDHQSRNTQTRKDQGKWEGQEMNHPPGEKSFNSSREDQFNQNPNRYRDTESAGVIDEDRGLFEDEEMDYPSREKYQGESIDTENSSIDSPKKKNQAPPSKFS